MMYGDSMEEITTRFEIVRLAVKMADHETITVQARKLRDLSLDKDLNEIIALLESRNYRQALFLMKGYVNSLDDSFFDTPTPAPAPKKQKVQEPVPETQNLFDMMQPQTSKTINLDDMLRMTEESAEESVMHSEPLHTAEKYVAQAKQEVEKNEAYLDIHKNRAENKTVKPFEESEVESLVDITGTVVIERPTGIEEVVEEQERVEEPFPETVTSEEILETVAPKETVDSLLSEESLDEPEEIPAEQFPMEEIRVEGEEIEAMDPQTDLQDEPENEGEVESEEHTLENALESISQEPVDSLLNMLEEQEEEQSDLKYMIEEKESDVKAETIEIERTLEEESSLKELAPSVVSSVVKKAETLQESKAEEHETKTLEIKRKEDYSKDNRRYPPISYIDQKFRNMRHQFPQIVQSEQGIIDEVKRLLKQMATQGYTENDIKDAISFFQEKKAEGNLAEAAQMLLLAAASESKYAQLLLARELFKGEVLKADYPESFTQINRLAEHDYPEAICDLAQLYEYGYGIKKDKKTAQLLYEEAAEMGVARAQKHVERLSSKRGILSAFFK